MEIKIQKEELNKKIQENRDGILKTKGRIEILESEKQNLQNSMFIAEGQARVYAEMLKLEVIKSVKSENNSDAKQDKPEKESK